MKCWALVVLLAGCAFARTSSPDPTNPTKPCNTSEVGPVLDAAIAVWFGIGSAMVFNDYLQHRNSEFDDSSDELTASAIGASLTALLTYSAIRGFRNVNQCRHRHEQIAAISVPQRQPHAAVDRRPEAWTLTKRAAAAARAGDCETVKTYEAVIMGVDADMYAAVFLQDAAIARCLTPSAAPEASDSSSLAPPAAAGAGSGAP